MKNKSQCYKVAITTMSAENIGQFLITSA